MKSVPKSVFWVSVAAFALFSVAAGLRLFHDFDLWSLRATQEWNTAFFDRVGELFSTLGGIEFTAVALLVLLSVLFYLGRRMLAVRVLVAFLVTSAVEIAMKLWLPQAPLPETFSRSDGHEPLVTIGYSYPYPSGHMLRTTILLGIIFMLWKNRPGRVLLAAILALMALTRVYMGVHWASDVVGGLLLGVVGLAWAFLAKKRRMRWR